MNHSMPALLSITSSWSLLSLMSIELVMPSSHLILCCPLLLLPPSLPASGSFPMRQVFAWGSQNIGVSASASVLPMNTQDWSPLGWTGWISLQSMGLSRFFSNTTVQKHQFFGAQLSSQSQLSYPYLTTGKTIAVTRWTFGGKAVSLLFNMVSRLVITFLPRNKRLNFMAAVTICSDFGAPETEVWHCLPVCFPWGDGSGCHDLSVLFRLLSLGVALIPASCTESSAPCTAQALCVSGTAPYVCFSLPPRIVRDLI